MTEASKVDKIAFLSLKTEDDSLKSVRRSIENTIDGESYIWNMARVLDDGTITCNEE